MLAISAITLPMLVSTAANPTTLCKAATVCGSDVGVMRRPIIAPKAPRLADEMHQSE
jgi:hypothetical protein